MRNVPAIRYGMAGGGEGAFIGAVHRLAARLDNEWQLVCGAFSSDAERNDRSGTAIGLTSDRCYSRFDAMIAAESALPLDERMEVLVICTPNHLHRSMAIEALDAGIAVLSDKPMALDLSDAQAIAEAAARSTAPYGLTMTYSGYPMVEEARARIATEAFGAVRRVDVEYRQGWLSTAIDREGHKQASWRTDPSCAGIAGALGDIGTHAFHLAEYVSGLTAERLCADLAVHVAGRRLDDDASILMQFAGGARGTLIASQICAGEENALRLRVSCELATLEWAQEEPNSLIIRHRDRPIEILRTAGPGNMASAVSRTRIPAGHPEGYLEAFGNIYQAFAAAVRECRKTPGPPGSTDWFPGVSEGLRGMAFVSAAVSNAKGMTRWTRIGSGTTGSGATV